MDRVFTFADQSAVAGHWVAVAVGEPNPDQLHIGIIHRDRNTGLQFLHLAWHCRLRNDDKRPDYLSVWVPPSVPAERQRIIAAFCRRVWRKNARDGIPYAFSNPQESFNPATAAFLIGPTRFGLTCASFVFAVFDAAGLRLAEYESWPVNRPGDGQWQETIIGQLESQTVGQAHINHLRSEIGAVRYRPEEVVASTALAPPPLAFAEAEQLGRRIISRIRSLPDAS